MFRLIATGLVVYAAYKWGENKSRLEQLDFFITKVSGQGTNILLVEYATIDTSGNLIFSQDMNLATVLNYWDAINIKSMLKKFAPTANVQLESVSALLNTTI